MSGESRLRELSGHFARHEGRQPRVMVAAPANWEEEPRMGEIAVLLANFGFNVDLGPLFKKELDLASNAVESDVDLLLISGLRAGDPENLIRAIEASVQDLGRGDMIVMSLPEKWRDRQLTRQIETSLEALLGP